MMAGIRAKDTRPEMIVRKGIHARGFRFRLHVKKLPGTPDLVFPCHNAVIFVHGCFWHGHGCHLFKWPRSRPEFWRKKINGNRIRHSDADSRLRRSGWRVLVIWECVLKGSKRRDREAVLDEAADWLRSSLESLAIGTV